MPKKRCGFRFSCAAMMLQPGLEAADCPNYEVCGSVSQLLPEEEVELQMVREERVRSAQEQYHRSIEVVCVNFQQAAVMMLMQRGCPQSLDSLGVTELISQAEMKLEKVRSHLNQYDDQYIAPEGCQAHQYNVKRPHGTYWYNKLAAREAIFEPAENMEKVKVLHLSYDDDPRNLEAREGIERRNQLTQLRTQLSVINEALEKALAIISPTD
jgi:hypothetical protein